jgi:hypothetical protein
VFAGEMLELERLKAEDPSLSLRTKFEPWRDNEPVSESNPLRFIVSATVSVHAAAPNESPREHRMRVLIGYPPNYPFDPLDIRPAHRDIRRRRHQGGQSREFCYVQEELDPLQPEPALAGALAGARQWLQGEVTGEWNEVQAAELLSYFDQHSAAVGPILIPKHGSCAPDGGKWGTFDLEIARWGAPGVVGAFRLHRSRKDTTSGATVRRANDMLWAALGMQRSGVPVVGLWFRLKREPERFHDRQGLEQALRDAGEFAPQALEQAFRFALDQAAAGRGWLPVAIEYPARAQDGIEDQERTEWLWLALEWSAARAKGTYGANGRRRAASRNPRLVHWNTVTVKGIQSFDVGADSLRRRVGGLYPVHEPTTTHIVIVGLGALGSTVARSLAEVGYRCFTLVDHDIMKPGNIVRHELGLPSIGKKKVRGMKRLILEVNRTGIAGGSNT